MLVIEESSQNKEYVLDFQAPGLNFHYKRPLDYCKLVLTTYRPHDFDSLVEKIIQYGKNPFYYFPNIVCACCNDNRFWDLSIILDKPLQRYICPNCNATICDICANCYFKYPVQTENRKCKWCRKKVFPPNQRKFSLENQTDFIDYIQYMLAGSGIKSFGYWVLFTKRKYDISKIIWKFLLNTNGWKFFLDCDFLLRNEHPNQYKFLLANMIWKTDKNIPYQINNIHMLYHQPRQIAIMHNFGIILSKKMTNYGLLRNSNKNYCTMKQYIKFLFANKLRNMYGYFLMAKVQQ
jgi:hypothetical protein